MKKLILALAATIALASAVFAQEPAPKLQYVKRHAHPATRHHAHRATRHHTPRHRHSA